MGRGELTKKTQEIAKKMIGREISLRELRLLPYVHTVMMNEQRIDPNKISPEERKILSTWRKKGFIEGGASGLGITKDFWDFTCEILFETYVDNRD